METQEATQTPVFAIHTLTTHRKSKRQQIVEFFVEHTNEDFATDELHRMFGTSFRTRVSEINRDPKSAIRIVNTTSFDGERETSVYRGEWRQ